MNKYTVVFNNRFTKEIYMQCPDCNGTGWIYRFFFIPVSTCPLCENTGEVVSSFPQDSTISPDDVLHTVQVAQARRQGVDIDLTGSAGDTERKEGNSAPIVLISESDTPADQPSPLMPSPDANDKVMEEGKSDRVIKSHKPTPYNVPTRSVARPTTEGQKLVKERGTSKLLNQNGANSDSLGGEPG